MCNNVGGKPRYNINNINNNNEFIINYSCFKMNNLCNNLVEQSYQKIKNMI